MNWIVLLSLEPLAGELKYASVNSKSLASYYWSHVRNILSPWLPTGGAKSAGWCQVSRVVPSQQGGAKSAGCCQVSRAAHVRNK
jgi:hypothetical protein